MKLLARLFVILMLLFNGIGAFYGGLSLITDPSGERLQLPATYLQNIPFKNYLIPGIVLIIVNGCFSFVTLTTLLTKQNKGPDLVIIQGVLLTGWIIIQLFMVKDFYPQLHLTMLVIGLLFIALGFYIKKLT